MAYTPNTLVTRYGGFVEGSFNVWEYTSTDPLNTILGSGYFVDGSSKGMQVGDVVLVVNQTTLAAVKCQCSASTVVTTGGLTQHAGSSTIVQQEQLQTNLGALPRNLIDCGDFTTNPWQLGASFNGNGPSSVLTADRWKANSGTSLVWTAGQASNTNVPGFSAAYQWGRSAGDTHTVGLTFGQVLETKDSIRAQGQTLALSFWNVADANFAAGSSGGTFVASIIAGTGVDDTANNMFSGAWTGQTTVATQVITPGTTISRLTPIVGTVPTNATQLGVAFSYVASAGTTAGTHESLQFMGVQLEFGASATPFEHTEVAEVVNIATRYLQVTNEPTVGMAIGPAAYSASSIAQVHIPLPSPMRKAPTLTFTAGGFAITDSALGAHTISAAGLQVANTGAVTLLVTAATTLTAGLVSFMQGRSTNDGVIILSADY